MEVGRVVQLWRFPVKSMAGEPLDAADVAWHGLAGDRRWAFAQDSLVRSGFPWLTIRERSDMAHFRPRFADADRPDQSATLVRLPGGAEVDVVDPALAEALGGGVRVIKQNRGAFDTSPLSLVTTQAIDRIGGLVGRPLDTRRFRMNLVVEAVDGSAPEAFPEDAWIGATLRIGDVRLRVDRPDQRCVLVNVDPDTAERDPAVLRAIARHHDACLGVYGTTVAPGRVRVGDPVVLEAPA